MTDQDLYAMRHSLAHIMASAIQRLWPETKFGVGPVVEDGFYYDIDAGESNISEEHFKKIEKEMRKIINEDQPFELSNMPIDKALEWAQQNNQPYKLELLNDLAREGKTLASELDAATMGLPAGISGSAGSSAITEVSFYTNGDFCDLCRGPHVESTGKVGAFKLMKIAGAYWRGKEDNPQMQRLYGVAFETQEQLQQHLQMLEEAKARDHRKIGKEMDLFTFSDLVGPGLPLYTPRGTVIIEEIRKYLREISAEYDMDMVSIPHLAKIDLYEISGHASKFEEELFRVSSHYNQEFILKPVNCPHHTQIYAAKPRSYKELPIRYVEQTMQYRDEKPGQLSGLQRTRGFTVDDGHTFCRPDQIEDEVSMLIEVIQDFYKSIGLWGNHWVSLSVRDSETDRYIGDPADWDTAERMLESAAQKYELSAKMMEGEAAIYGPKLDFMFKDALGRETQLATIQLDFAMPKRFELEYIDSDGAPKTPVMIHRAILGSFERFIMLLIEHFAGKFPVWLAPEQLRIATVSEDSKMVELAKQIEIDAKKLGIRVGLDIESESVGKKIRQASVDKVPYVVVIGDKEVESGKVTPRIREDLAVEGASEYAVANLLQTIANEAKSRVNKSSL